jgi:hypothetical protein
MGHSEIIANEHHVRVTDHDFAQATGTPSEEAEKAVQKAAQNPAQYTAAYTSENQQAKMTAHEKTLGFPGFAETCGSVPTGQAEGMGLEPTTPCGAPDFESGS